MQAYGFSHFGLVWSFAHKKRQFTGGTAEALSGMTVPEVMLYLGYFQKVPGRLEFSDLAGNGGKGQAGQIAHTGARAIDPRPEIRHVFPPVSKSGKYACLLENLIPYDYSSRCVQVPQDRYRRATIRVHRALANLVFYA